MRKKAIIISIAAATFSLVTGLTSFAAGWQQDAKGWWYGTNADNSSWYSNGWQWIDGNGDGVAECYYFDSNGYLLTNTKTPDGYQVNSEGAWVQNGEIQHESTKKRTQELRKYADSVNIAHDAKGAGADIRTLYNQGMHIFDTAYLLSDNDKTVLESKISAAAAETGFAIAIFTVSEGDSGAVNVEDFADMLYYYGDLGEGSGKDGVILVLDMYARSVYIYTHGIAIRYITDSVLNYIFDDLDGGLFNSIKEGNYAKACNIFTNGVVTVYRGGISPYQFNYNVQTGEIDFYIS